MVVGMILVSVPRAMATEEVVHYFYDDAGRLVAAGYSSLGANAAIQYKYDANGNRTNRTSYGHGDTTDSDVDEVHDVDELAFFGDLDETGSGDPDGDGLVNSYEFALGGNPMVSDTDLDGMDDSDEAVAGTLLYDSDDVFEVMNVDRMPSGDARIWWKVKNGRSYRLQMRPTLMSGTWGDVGTPYESTSNSLHYADEAYTTNAFFRVKVWITP